MTAEREESRCAAGYSGARLVGLDTVLYRQAGSTPGHTPGASKIACGACGNLWRIGQMVVLTNMVSGHYTPIKVVRII